MTKPAGHLASSSLDCPDPEILATFHSSLLGLKEAFATPDRSVIAPAGAGPMLTLMRVDSYLPPSWPEEPQHQQPHLDVAVEELDSASAATLALGSTAAGHQASPESWHVMLNPAGHPSCITMVRPD